MVHKIIQYIEKHSPVSYETLEERARLRGMTSDELDVLLTKVHKDKRVKATTAAVNGKQSIVYMWHPPVYKAPGSHLTWVNDHYPRFDYEMPFPEWDLSFMFLKPAEMLDYKAQLTGRTQWQVKSQNRKSKQKYSSTSVPKGSFTGGRTTKQYTTRNSGAAMAATGATLGSKVSPT